MINLNRPAQVPESLQNPRMKEYLGALAAYKADPENNNEPKPPVGYRDFDIIRVFESHFFSKCYLTEWKYNSAWSLEIDHFIPVGEEAEGLYEWANLFPISSQANKMRPKKTPEGGYLDPCNPEHDVETEIVYSIQLLGELISFIPRDPSNTRAKNTADLLNRLHNGHSGVTEETVKELQILVRKQYNLVLHDYCVMREDPNETERVLAKERLKFYLSKKSPFTMLLRNSYPIKLLGPEFFID